MEELTEAERRQVEKEKQLPVRPFEDLSPSGLLWLINRVVFHPRGYALSLVADDAGTVTGWKLLGDGRQPWTMGDEEHEANAAREFLDVHRAYGSADATIRHADEVIAGLKAKRQGRTVGDVLAEMYLRGDDPEDISRVLRAQAQQQRGEA